MLNSKMVGSCFRDSWSLYQKQVDGQTCSFMMYDFAAGLGVELLMLKRNMFGIYTTCQSDCGLEMVLLLKNP